MTQWVHHWTAVVLVAAPLVAVVFFGVLAALGIAPEDRALVASLARRSSRVSRAGAA
jgi:hypothetical protein